jgi:hypothetical protein
MSVHGRSSALKIDVFGSATNAFRAEWPNGLMEFFI